MFGFVKNKNIVLIRFFIGLFSFPWPTNSINNNTFLNPYIGSATGLKAITGDDSSHLILNINNSISVRF